MFDRERPATRNGPFAEALRPGSPTLLFATTARAIAGGMFGAAKAHVPPAGASDGTERARAEVSGMWAEDGPSLGTGLDEEDLQSLPECGQRKAGLLGDHEHHLLPQELERKGFYTERGFDAGEIHNYTTSLPEADHQAIHGGGNYKLARQHWPEGSWNERLKMEYRKNEARAGRKMTKEDILVHMERMRQLFGIADRAVGPYKEPR